MPRLTSFSVSIRLPVIGGLSGTWAPDDAERRAAWEMYVELATRIAVVELGAEGLLREALSSLHTLFDTTRDILRRYGPGVAQPTRDGSLSFGVIAVTVLNGAIRPVLSRWHPELLGYEATRPDGVSIVAHEREWSEAARLRQELTGLRETLLDYADLLGDVAGVSNLTTASEVPA